VAVEGTLSSKTVEALDKIVDMVLPYSVDWSQVKDHITGYNREKAKAKVLEKAKGDPLFTKIRLHLIYVELKKLADNGGLL